MIDNLSNLNSSVYKWGCQYQSLLAASCVLQTTFVALLVYSPEAGKIIATQAQILHKVHLFNASSGKPLSKVAAHVVSRALDDTSWT